MEGRTAPKEKRGFTALLPARRREVVALSGKTAQQRGIAHRWTKEEAQQAHCVQGAHPYEHTRIFMNFF